MRFLAALSAVALASLLISPTAPCAQSGCQQHWFPPLGDVSKGVYAFAVYDDGGGPALYCGGDFDQVAGVPAVGVARWDGKTWSGLGSGVVDSVSSLCVYDDGLGPALFAGGWISQAGGLPMNGVARWDGTSWQDVGAFPSSPGGTAVYALKVWDDGGGPALYAGGKFPVMSSIARWDGVTWTTLGTGVTSPTFNAEVRTLEVFDDGGGPALYAGGGFTDAGGVSVSGIARWDGASWSAVPGLFAGTQPGYCHALRAHDDGSGPALYATGGFDHAGPIVAGGLARWRGAWEPVGGDLDGGLDPFGRAFASFGGDLFLGGQFKLVGGVLAKSIARWDGSAWSGLLGGLEPSVYCMGVFDDGWLGESLLVGDASGHLARFGCKFKTVPGCALNPALLWAVSSTATLGQAFEVRVDGALASSGIGVLFHGVTGVDAGGCGVVAPGIGELLLAAAPAPAFFQQLPLYLGVALFKIALPADPALAGLKQTLQGAAVDFGLTQPIELTNALEAVLLAPW
jgi:hypothetical protein